MVKKWVLPVVCLCFLSVQVKGQKWVDTSYAIQEIQNVEYGKDVDFGGTMRSLRMDICTPTNDIVPPCGRPLLLVVHGGAFLAGDKASDAPPRIMRDFAKRGYLTASINYRLGFFQSSSQVNCNISSAGAPWNCLNASDSGEWERALYRGMQDAKGALRYLVNQSSIFKIDARNVFLVGESAGGFVVLSTAFMDDDAEKPASCGVYSTVNRPNKIYENQCVVSPGFASSIDSLKLQRPDMGNIKGTLNLSASTYQIRGVGNFFGGMYSDLFSLAAYKQAPVLYMFHQPNDLIVPYRVNKLFADYAYCATQFPANCQYIVNRKTVMGSRGIYDLINSLAVKGKNVPKVLFDSTLNTTDCLGQIANPSLAGHAIDNYALRTKHMAQLFADVMDTTKACDVTAINENYFNTVNIYPNPASAVMNFESGFNVLKVEIMDITSKTLLISYPEAFSGQIDVSCLKSGMYFIRLSGELNSICKPIWVE